MLQDPAKLQELNGTGETTGEGLEEVRVASTVKTKRLPTEQRAGGPCGRTEESGLINSSPMELLVSES